MEYIRWFETLGMEDVALVGGKNANLGEMVRGLKSSGVPVPDGFAITAEGYRDFLDANGLREPISQELTGLDFRDIGRLQAAGRAVRQAILGGRLPEELERQAAAAYGRLVARRQGRLDVAVRSSATAEDLPEASFAGQQETYLNVQGAPALLESVKRCFASLFTDRAIVYRAERGYDPLKVALSVGVQEMVRSDLGAAGVMFSIDTETGFEDVVLINAAYGLGESVVQGAVTPDEYMVFKPTLKQGFAPILERKAGSKEFKLVYDTGGERRVRNVPVSRAERERLVLGDDEVLRLARWACVIEDHYSRRRGRPSPMDMEWARDGMTGGLYLLQARPETVQSRRREAAAPRRLVYALEERGEPVLRGRSVGERIAAGPARVIGSAAGLAGLREGEVLVTDRTDPDWEPAMKRAAAIVTNRGGRTCHAAIVARELGIPAVVGTERGTEALRTGEPVTVSAAEGEEGYVYRGRLRFSASVERARAPRKLRTRIMMNVANPEEALRLSMVQSDGVGLARLEFIIGSSIRIHPMALIRYPRLADAEAIERIRELTGDCPDKPGYFVERLAEKVGTIAAAFYPRDVIVRMSDFKTNEYANLVGGREFEPREENPMLGFRGASRYADPAYREGFALECRAMRKARDEMGLRNIKLMIPFCRTLEEGRRVIAELERNGLRRGERGLEVYVMCEIPSNVLLADAFSDIFDGFSIGSNDLTQLVLGVDRDSEKVAASFDERNPAVLRMIAEVVRAARARGRKIGVCGQAPSDYPEFARFLVEQGIDSISLSPDSLEKIVPVVEEAENSLAAPRRQATV